jgi:hypothetical protein
MVVRKSEKVLCVYTNSVDRDVEVLRLKSEGYVLTDEGYASFDAETLKGTDLKPGEIYMYVTYEK